MKDVSIRQRLINLYWGIGLFFKMVSYLYLAVFRRNVDNVWISIYGNSLMFYNYLIDKLQEGNEQDSDDGFIFFSLALAINVFMPVIDAFVCAEEVTPELRKLRRLISAFAFELDDNDLYRISAKEMWND